MCIRRGVGALVHAHTTEARVGAYEKGRIRGNPDLCAAQQSMAESELRGPVACAGPHAYTWLYALVHDEQTARRGSAEPNRRT